MKKERQKKSKKLIWLERIAIFVGLWFIFFPRPYEFLLIILLILPIIGMLFNSKNQPSICSLITIKKKAKRKYDVIDFIDIPAFVILLRVLIDYEFDSFQSILITGSITLILVLFTLFLTHKQIKESKENKYWLYLLIFFNLGLYSYAGTAAVNCAFDYSDPVVYESKVLGKKISKSRRRKTYYIKVNAWGHHVDSEKISVTPSQYKEIEIGDIVKIDFKQGLLGIPWYYIE